MSPFGPSDSAWLCGAAAGLKLAARLPSALGGAGAFLGLGGGAGALLGGGAGALGGYRDARAQGADRGQAIAAGLESAGRGAVLGGAAGAALGAAGGAAAGSLAPKATEAARSAVTATKGPVGSLARFGQRQVHGLTGHTPEGGLEAIGHGASTRRAAVDAAEGKLDRVIEEGGRPGLLAGLRGQSAVEEAAGGVRRANQAYGAAADAERRGLTSLPGYARAIRRDGLVPTLRAGFRDQTHGMGPGMKALTLGMPAADLMSAAAPDEPGGPPRSERLGRAIGGAAGVALSPLPQGTQLLVGPALAALGGRAGRAIGPAATT